MVRRDVAGAWFASRKEQSADGTFEGQIRKLLEGVEAEDGILPARSKQVACSEGEEGMGEVWMQHKDMNPSRVATDLRLSRYFGTSAEFWLGLQKEYDLRLARQELGATIDREVAPLSQAS